jgi:uncharacterized repeat protein (TIGR01451 family)
MKNSKLLMLGILAVSLTFATSAVLACNAQLSCGNTAYFVSNDAMAICVYQGDELYYIVTVSLGLGECPIINGEVTFTAPDGRTFLLDDDLSLNPGESMPYDLRQHPDWMSYFVNCGDPLSFSQCEALSNVQPGVNVPSTGTGTWALYCKVPCIEVTKTPDTDQSKTGDTVNYEICVTNCSTGNDELCNLTLYNIQVVDTLLGGPLPGFPSVLAPGDTVCLTFPYVVQPGDPDPLLNEVTATAVDNNGRQAEDVDNAEVDLVHPSIDITKTVTPPTSKAGDQVTYTITVTNTSPDVSLEHIVVTDPLLGPGPLAGFPATLAAGASSGPVNFIRTILGGDPDPLVNTATVHADPLGLLTNDITANDSATVDLVHPSFTVQKDCPETAEVGETIPYLLTITNTGDVPLVIVSAIDDHAGSVPGTPGAPLPPGVPITFPYNYTVLPSDAPVLTNIVTVTVRLLTDPPLPNQLTQSDDCTTEVGQPGTEITIEPSATSVCEGESVTLTICEDNTGDVDLTHVYVEFSVDGLTVPLVPPLDKDNPTLTGDDGDGVLQTTEKWCWTVVVTVDTTTTYDARGHGTDPAGNDITIPTYPTEYDEVTINTEECGGEGCTPGFWTNNAANWGASAWCNAYEPGDDFNTVFGIPEKVLNANGKNKYNNPTLLQALDANGGGINALARHAVAALLNACSGCVEYATDNPQDIIDAVQAAVAAGPEAIQDLHELLASYNEAGCPVNQNGDCVGIEDEI